MERKNKTKINIIIFISVYFITLTVVSVIMIFNSYTKNTNEKKIVYTSSISPSASGEKITAQNKIIYPNIAYINTANIKYLIKITDDDIYVYDSSRRFIVGKLDADYKILPESDQEFLRNGIEIYSNEELLSVICDISS